MLTTSEYNPAIEDHYYKKSQAYAHRKNPRKPSLFEDYAELDVSRAFSSRKKNSSNYGIKQMMGESSVFNS
jgi:hypothetical protein